MNTTHQMNSLGLIVAALSCSGELTPSQVLPGIDVLLADSAHVVSGRRVGIITNQTGVDAKGVDDITRLRAAGVHLTAIFSPEHGFRGVEDREDIQHGVDSATGLPIYSLYGTERAPTAEMLDAVDVLLIDLPDIGARTYTYVSTALSALAAAAEYGIQVVVLDRPNPIGGDLVQGPLLDSAFASFVGMLPVPLRHGMTMGELVRFGNRVLEIAGDLTVIPAVGWQRSAWFDQTGLPWIRPSLNLPDLESASHYPGIVLFERTNLSVGRGTPIAFQMVGAPWLDAARVATELAGIDGVLVSDTTVQPESPSDGKYHGAQLPAVRFRVQHRDRYDPTRLAVALLAVIGRVHGDSLVITAPGFDERAGSDQLRLALEEGREPAAIWGAWEGPLAEFRRMRQRFLLY